MLDAGVGWIGSPSHKQVPVGEGYDAHRDNPHSRRVLERGDGIDAAMVAEFHDQISLVLS
jgi:hypothetical protein